MSKPIYIGITQNPPKIVSIGETIDGMKMVDILLDNEKLDDITSQLQLEFDELDQQKTGQGTETPIDPASDVLVVPTQVDPASDVPVVPTQGTDVPTQVVTEETHTTNGVRATLGKMFTRKKEQPSQANSSSGTGTGNNIGRYAGLNAMGNIVGSVFSAGRKTKKHKTTKRYKNRQMKRRKTKRTHK